MTTILQKNPFLKLAALPFLLALLIYAPSLGNGFFAIDDGMLIFQNNLIREISPQTIYTIFTTYDPELYIPLSFLSFQFDYLIGGYHPFIYHLTNLLLHAGSSVLVVGVVWMLFRCGASSLDSAALSLDSSPSASATGSSLEKSMTVNRDAAAFIALFCGLLFAIHPIHTEAVAWASARKDVLSGFFFLLSLCLYLKESGIRNQESGRSFKKFLIPNSLSLIAFFLALLAKVTVATLPVVLLLTDWHQGRSLKKAKNWINKIPYLILSIIFGIIALGGKSGILQNVPLIERVLISCKMAVFAFWKLIAPFNLNVLYPELSPITITNPEFALSAGAIALVIISMIWLRRYKTITFGILFFLITIAPSFFTTFKGGINFLFSDRYVYLSSIGAFLIFGSLLSCRGKFSISNLRIFKQFSKSNFQWTLLSVIIVVLSVLTVSQSLLWKDGVSMFKRTVKLYPDFYLAHIDLGASYKAKGMKEEALESFKNAVELYPKANTFGVIGGLQAEFGNFDEAVRSFMKGIEKLPDDPELRYGLGQVYALMGESDKALESYQKAYDLSEPDLTRFHEHSRGVSSRRDMILMRMGIIYGERADHKTAMEYYMRALEENPWNADAYFNLGVGLSATGDMSGALENFKKAVELDPDLVEARVNLGILLMRVGQKEEAREQFREVLKIEPENEVADRLLQQME